MNQLSQEEASVKIAEAEEKVTNIALFNGLLQHIKDNATFNNYVSLRIGKVDIENLNIKDFQSLYYDYIMIVINKALPFIQSDTFSKHLANIFNQPNWQQYSANYSDFKIFRHTLGELKDILQKTIEDIEKHREDDSLDF